MKKIYFILFCFTSITLSAQQIEDFSLTNAIDGKTVSLKNYGSSAGVVIIFVVNDCPFDGYYGGRISNLSKGKLPLLLVNAHPDQSTSMEGMTKYSKDHGIDAPYLADKDQTVMQMLGAHKSAEAFLLKNSNGKFSIYYRGAIDDNPQVATDVKHPYLEEAIVKLLAGQTADMTGIRPVGCNIGKK
jgi:hypothetical protein